jgi:aminoglycoside phosphotransferase (APT) family kinase protein
METLKEKIPYSETMKDTLMQAIKAEMGFTVQAIEKIPSGSMNHVFKVDTSSGIVIARVFGQKNSPDTSKLFWIDKKLAENDIDSPRILFGNRSSLYFPYGFMMSEYVEGVNGWEAIQRGGLSLEEYHKKFGALVKQIHSIPLSETGAIKLSDKKYSFNWLDDVLDHFKKVSNFSDSDCYKIKGYIENTFAAFADRFPNVLCHCDIGLQNHLVADNKNITLIDWDLAEADSPFRDIATVTLGVKEMDHFGQRDVVTQKIRAAFLEGYGPTGLEEDEMIRIERAYHLISHIHNLPFHYDAVNGNQQDNETTKEIYEIINT